MASTVRSGAIYGIGVYGTDRYGVSSVTYTPDGVFATGTSDSGVVIIGDAVSVVVGVSCTAAVGGVGVVGVAVTNVVGVEATAVLGEASQRTINRIEVDGVEAVGAVGDVVVAANAVTDVDGVTAFSVVNIVNVTAASNVIINGVVAAGVINDNLTYKLDCKFDVNGVASVGLIGVLSITVTSFDYEAVKDLYDRKRTVFVERGTTSADRTVYVESESRMVYIEPRPVREIAVN